MKITRTQLRRIIREEKQRLVKENYGSDSEELNTLGAMAYRFAEELDNNEAFIRLERGDIDIPGLEAIVAEIIVKLRQLDGQIRSSRSGI